MQSREAHPDTDRLAAFDLGRLSPAERSAVEAHLAGCETCCRKLETVPDDALVALLRNSFPASQTPLPTSSRDTDDGSNFADNTPTPAGPPATMDVPVELLHHPRYRVLAPLGAGGMGAVFKAEHLLMGRMVALKIISSRLTDRPAAVERFRQEVRAAARLSHPHIVAAYDAEQAGEVHFLVMEYVEGASLDRVLAREGPQPVRRACAWIRQAALGLQHAFEQGMVHRDIKPGNLLLSQAPGPESAGLIKVLDFGLARFASENANATPLTDSGLVVGTPDYIAPEQAEDPRRADIRADVYSLGCTLYHLLAGRPPFAEGTPFQKLLAHRDLLPPPITVLRPDVPAELARVVERMMAKDPAQRYPTPAEVARALAPFTQPETKSREGEKEVRSKRRRLLVAAVTLVALVGVGGYLAWRQLHQPNPSSHLVNGADRSANGELSDSRELRRIGGVAGPFSAVAFSDDCKWALAADADHTILIWDLEEGKETVRLDGHSGPVLALAFSPDGRKAVSGGTDQRFGVWDLAEPRLLHMLKGHSDRVRGVVFSHDSRHALSGSDDGSLLLWDTQKPKDVPSTPDSYAIHGIALEKYGRFVAAGCSDKAIRVIDLHEDRRTGTLLGHTGAVSALAWSREDYFLLSGSADSTVRFWRVMAKRPLGCFEGHAGEVLSVALSKDLRRALSGGADRTIRLWDVYTGKELACFKGHADGVLSVAFCPDNRQAVSGSRDGTFRFWQLPECNDDQPTPYTERVHAVAVTPDGTTLALRPATRR